MKRIMQSFGIPFLAVALALATSAFTAPKAAGTANSFTGLYWYNVDLSSQTVLQNTPYTFAEDVAGCPTEGSDIDCKRGYEAPIDVSSGPANIPTTHRKMTVEQ